MTWLYWSSFVILLGAEINGEVLQASGDGTLPLKQTPPEKKRGSRSATSRLVAGSQPDLSAPKEAVCHPLASRLE